MAVSQSKRQAILYIAETRGITEDQAKYRSVENAALSFVPESYLGPLSVAASAAMIKELGGRCGLRFDKDAAELIAQECGWMPYWIRRACSSIHRSIDVQARPTKVTVEFARAAVDEFVAFEGAELARVAVSHLFAVFPELQPVCESARNSTSDTTRSQYHRVIEKYGLIGVMSGRFFMPSIVKAGLAAYGSEDPSSTTAALPVATQPSQPAVGNWAEDLAIIGKRRNLIEAKLRALMLGLIRADVLGKKGSAANVSERIRAAVPSKRHIELPTDPDQTMEKLYCDVVTELEKIANPASLSGVGGVEGGFFLQDEWQITPRLQANIGTRASYFSYGDYLRIEPRDSLAYSISDNVTARGGYSAHNQYLHMITRNDVALPTDIWFPATSIIKPATSQQIAAGVETRLFNNEVLLSVEGYYKTMDNLLEFKDTASFSLVTPLESSFAVGSGKSYGVEFFLRRAVRQGAGAALNFGPGPCASAVP